MDVHFLSGAAFSLAGTQTEQDQNKHCTVGRDELVELVQQFHNNSLEKPSSGLLMERTEEGRFFS